MRAISGRVRKTEVSMVVAILFILVFVLPVVSTHGEADPPSFTATRCISPSNITPGSTFNVMIILNVNQSVINLTLDEEIPTDWTVARADSAGAIFNASELKWTWPSVSAGGTKTVSYDVTVHSNATKRSYPISGKISATNATATSVGGELTVTVTTPTTTTEIPDGVAIFAGLVILAVFVMLIILGFKADKQLDKGEMRRAIAGTFVVGFTILLILCLTYGIYQNEVIIAYIELTGIVVGFYFGAKTAAEKRAEAAAEITIENVRFPAKEVAIAIRNGGDSKITVDTIYINKEAFKPDSKQEINPHKSKEIVQAYDWYPKTEYKIKIATTTGLTDEITASSPKEKTAEPEK